MDKMTINVFLVEVAPQGRKRANTLSVTNIHILLIVLNYTTDFYEFGHNTIKYLSPIWIYNTQVSEGGDGVLNTSSSLV
jgi:hypothetical protein